MSNIALVASVIAALLYLCHKLLQELNKSQVKPNVKLAAKSPYNSKEEIQQPTPLFITPEQVKTYDDRPWRPFRWPYHQTMNILKLDINHWLDMDKFYWRYIEEKKRIIHEFGKDNVDWLPESYDACFELMETVTQHMLGRYPLLFKSKDKAIHVTNELTGEVLDMSLPLKEHPLIYVSKMVKEDFFIVKKRDDGIHYLVAAAVHFPGGSFGMQQKLGKSIDYIHTDVPHYETGLKKSMEKWFDKMKAANPVERASWYMTWDHDLLCSDVYGLEKGAKVDPSVLPTKFNVRVERQTLRRLPKSQATIFTNHPVFYSVEEMKDEPMVPSLLKKIMFEASPEIVKYKNFESFRDHIVPYLDDLIERQIKLGLIKRDQPVKTLKSYPFAHCVKQSDEFKGWNMEMVNPKVEV